MRGCRSFDRNWLWGDLLRPCIVPNANRFGDTVGFKEKKWETIDLLDPSDPSVCVAPDGVGIKIPRPHLHFAHLFNAYGKWYNKRFDRHGSLFERPFKRKLIDSETYLSNMALTPTIILFTMAFAIHQRTIRGAAT